MGGPGRVEPLAGTSPADPELTAFMARESQYLLEQRKRLEAGSAFAANVRRLWSWRGGSLAAYAREVGHHAETVRSWMEGRQTPRWVAVLVVAFRFGLHAIDLLTAPVEGGACLGGRPAHAAAVRKLKPVLNKHNPAELERHLQSVLGSEVQPPISLAAAGRQVGCHSGFLKRKFPEMAAKISERHRSYWSTSKQQRLFFARRVTQAKASEIAARGEYPSQRKVARLLPAQFDLRMPVVREALDDTLREWGFMAPRGEAREASR